MASMPVLTATVLASVGRGGVNRTSDVETVQFLLNRFALELGITPLKVDGHCGAMTERAIVEFQRRFVNRANPDGRVDPGGRTIAALGATFSPATQAAQNANAAPANAAGDTQAKVTYHSSLPADKRIVHDYAFKLIGRAAANAGMTAAVITSTIRTPREQAETMYGYATQNLAGQYKLYGATGDLVLDVYKANMGKPREGVIDLMSQKIDELAQKGRRVSRHVVPLSIYQTLNVIDIGVNSTMAAAGASFSKARLTAAFVDLQKQGYLTFIDETNIKNNCWHLEIRPNAKPL